MQNHSLIMLLLNFAVRKSFVINEGDFKLILLLITLFIDNLISTEYGGILPLEIEEKLRKIHDRIPEISSIYYIESVLNISVSILFSTL